MTFSKLFFICKCTRVIVIFIHGCILITNKVNLEVKISNKDRSKHLYKSFNYIKRAQNF